MAGKAISPYSLQVYETQSRGGSDALMSLTADAPFQAIGVGQFIELDPYHFPDSKPGWRLRVVEVSHMLWNSPIDETARHTVMVYVEWVGPSEQPEEVESDPAEFHWP